jgi:hypothetical protein
MLADQTLGQEIISRVARLSKKFGVNVVWQEDHGVIAAQ